MGFLDKLKNNKWMRSGLFGLVGGFSSGIKDWFKAKTGQQLSNAEREANAFQASEAQRARDWEEQQYLKYESPKATMDQYKAAGLNPALMFEGYSPSTPMTDVAAGSVSPHSETPIMSDLFNMISGAVSLKQSVDKNKADIALIDAERRNVEEDTKYKENENEWYDALKGNEFNLTWEQITKTGAETRRTEAELGKISQEIKESISRESKNYKDIEIGDKKIQLMGTEMDVNITKAALNRMTTYQIQKMLPYTEKLAEAQANFVNAQTTTEKQRAYNVYNDTRLKMLQVMKEEQLLDAGYVDELISTMKQHRQNERVNCIVGNICNVINAGANTLSAGADMVDAIVPF